LDFFLASRKSAQCALVFFKGIRGIASGLDNCLFPLDHELHTIAGGETEAVADFLRDGDLAFGAYGAGIFHSLLSKPEVKIDEFTAEFKHKLGRAAFERGVNLS
jgi:hypothetical protein